MLSQKYPGLAIEGNNFPPPTWKAQLAQFIGIAKILVIMLIVGTVNPFPFLTADGGTPAWFSWLLENKLYGCLMIFFVCNAVETQLISTGAFEVSLDDMPLWSKLEAGRIPQPPELFQILENHFKMNGGGGNAEYLTGGGAGHVPKDEL